MTQPLWKIVWQVFKKLNIIKMVKMINVKILFTFRERRREGEREKH